jgi:hypothetical protein
MAQRLAGPIESTAFGAATSQGTRDIEKAIAMAKMIED